jgi:hypothetical protein
MKPEEDCREHEWMDLYGGNGVSKNNINISLQAFFCKWCLAIQVRPWDSSRYKMSQELLEDFGIEEDSEVNRL